MPQSDPAEVSPESLVLDSCDDDVVESEDVALAVVLDSVVSPRVVDRAVSPLVLDSVALPLVLDGVVSAVPPELSAAPVLVVAPPVWESAVEADTVSPESSLPPPVVSEPVPPLDPPDAGSSKQPMLMRATRPRGKVRSVMS